MILGLASLTRLLSRYRCRGWTKSGNQNGLTAIETVIALLVVSMLSVFVLNVFAYSQRIQHLTSQVDFAAQAAREVLTQLKAEPNWREVERRFAKPVRKFNADFTFQLRPEEATEKGVTHLELTISWVGPEGVEQRVFSTSVQDAEAAQ